RVHEVPLTGGGSSYRRSVPPPALMLAAARTLLEALEWHGVAMVEFKREPDGRFCLMEVNPRLWGSLALAIDAGVNFPLGLWRIAAGEPHLPQPAYREKYFTRHLPKDLEWLKANVRADHRDPLLLTRPPLSGACAQARRPAPLRAPRAPGRPAPRPPLREPGGARGATRALRLLREPLPEPVRGPAGRGPARRLRGGLRRPVRDPPQRE